MLSLSMEEDGHRVSDFQVLDHPFKKSNQQGNYQAHLLDREGNKIREISFQKIESSAATDEDLIVSIPLEKRLYEVVIYQMDGRSGHYQVPDESLLTWKLPESVKEMVEPVQN